MLTTVRLVIYITSHSQAIIVSESMMLNVGSMRVLPEGDKVTCGIHSFTNFILCLFKTTFGMKPYLWCWKLIFHSIHGIVCVCVCVWVTQLCPTLCNTMECSSPGSSIHEITQARILEWVAIPFSRGSSQPRDQTQVSRIGGKFFTIWATREAYMA